MQGKQRSDGSVKTGGLTYAWTQICVQNNRNDESEYVLRVFIHLMVVFAMMNKYEYKTMISNMTVYLYFYIKKWPRNKEQAFVLQHRQVQTFLRLRN